MDQEILAQTKAEAARLLEDRKIQSALPLIRQAAHWGDLESQLLAADLYLHGLYGMPYNPYAGMEYVRLAAMNGDPHSMLELGQAFEKGEGLDKDLTKAFYFLNKAALYEEKGAFDPLGMMYLMGKGVEKDFARAKECFEKALSFYPEDEKIQKHLMLAEKKLADEQH